MLPSISWLDEETRAYAVKKAIAMTALIGSPLIPDPLSKLSLAGKSFYQMNVAVDQYDTSSYLGNLGNEYQRQGWSNIPQTVSAYNQGSPVQITVPAGIGQAPMFDPRYVNPKWYMDIYIWLM